MTATPRKPITVFIESEAGTNVKNRFDEKTLARSCPKIAVLTILGSRFASKPRMILQKRGLRKMAVHPCTASHCPPQNGVLGQELAHLGAFQLDASYPYPYGFIIGTKSADGESLDCYVATNLPLRSREQMECEAIGVLETYSASATWTNIRLRACATLRYLAMLSRPRRTRAVGGLPPTECHLLHPHIYLRQAIPRSFGPLGAGDSPWSFDVDEDRPTSLRSAMLDRPFTSGTLCNRKPKHSSIQLVWSVNLHVDTLPLLGS